LSSNDPRYHFMTAIHAPFVIPDRVESAPIEPAPPVPIPPRLPNEDRASLIQAIEKERKLRLLSLIVSDRSVAVGPIAQSPFQITHDIPRQILDHLQAIGHVPRIGIFLYSRGGDTSVPWVLVSLLREYCDELEVIIPFRAHSAATMIALGADQIVMGRHAQLGPIDPTIAFQETNQADPSKSKMVTIAVEDITSYIKLVKDGVGITDQRELGEAFGRLSSVVSPVTLGTINRQQAYIRMVARKLLGSRKNPPQVAETDRIVEGLISQTYFHQHVINRAEAVRDIGLDNVPTIDGALDDKIWSLFLNYERIMAMRSVVNGANLFAPADPDQRIVENVVGALIETATQQTRLSGRLVVTRARAIPQTLNVNLNVGLPGQLAQPGANIPQQLQALIPQLQAAIQAMVQEEVRKQAPVSGYGFQWTGDWEPLGDPTL
jgi:hypothetical protein